MKPTSCEHCGTKVYFVTSKTPRRYPVQGESPQARTPHMDRCPALERYVCECGDVHYHRKVKVTKL